MNNNQVLLMIIGAAVVFAAGYYLGRQSKTYGDFLDEIAEEGEPLED